MKVMLLLATVASSLCCGAQSDGTVFTVVQEMPRFPGGQDSMSRFLASHIVYPAAAADSALQGRVVVGYVVNADGSIGDVHVMRGTHPLLDAEAVRVVRTFPRHEPGMQGGQPVRVSMVVPVTFRVEAEPEFVPPSFPGGEQAMKDYIKANIRHRDGAKGFMGIVPVAFTVDSTGAISDIACLRHVSQDIDSEAVRVVRSFPLLQPARQRGSRVVTKVTLDVSFLDDKYLISEGGFYNATALTVQPDLIGGLMAKKAFVKVYLLDFYRKRDKAKGLSLQFTSNADSSISEIKMIDGLDVASNTEIIDLMKKIKKISPGIYGGHPVKTKVVLSIDTLTPLTAMPCLDVVPSFPGGDAALMAFLQREMIYPDFEKKNRIQGTVSVTFEVQDDGQVKNAKVSAGVHEGIDAEALRLVKMLPDFMPAMQNGKPVTARYNMAIAFKIAEPAFTPPVMIDTAFSSNKPGPAANEQMPQYPGGEAAMMRFVQENINYPDVERENDIQGRAVVGFVINEDGSISDIKMLKGVHKGIDEEAIRIVKLLPKFNPGRKDGKPVKVSFVLPIMFKLSSAKF